jgi:hypothetical protein
MGRPGQLRVVSSVEFCTGGCEAREAEESSLLQAIVREWLVKTQQVEKNLVDAVVI